MTKIYIITHKKCSIPNIPGYERLQVGSALHEDLGYLRDDTGDDHISDLNPYLAELTGMYWLWRNENKADNIGMCHYRRFFINEDKKILSPAEADEILSDYELITAQAERDIERASHPVFRVVGEVIRRMYPDAHDLFEDGCRTSLGSFGNLFIMRKPVFYEYCEWLFPLLTEALGQIDFSDYDNYHKKMLSIVAEDLLDVFIRTANKKVFHCKAALTDEKKETTELKNALAYLLREGKNTEAYELYQKVISERPDLTLDDSDPTGELRDLITKMLRPSS